MFRRVLPVPRSASTLYAVACAVSAAVGARDVHAQGGSGRLAVVVGRNSSVAQLSLDQLRRLYLGQTATLPTGQTALLLVYKPSAASFDARALDLTEAALKRRWVDAIFRGEAQAIPVEVATADEVKRQVAAHPNAVAYLPLDEVDDTVKVVRIDGRQPGDSTYPVR